MKLFAWILVSIGFLSLGIVIYIFLSHSTEIDRNLNIHNETWSAFGSVIGGLVGVLFSLAGFLIIYATLERQEDAIALQGDAFRVEKFESKFYEMIRIHRENVELINIEERSGRKVFLTLLREFHLSFDVVRAINESLPSTHKLTPFEVLNISYLCFFYGAVGEYSKTLISTALISKYDFLLAALLKSFEVNQKPQAANFGYQPFEGHQSRLGHYFRHLFQTMEYINSQPTTLFDYKEKYGYVKMLRAQFSTQEQELIFYNALSDIGAPWEKKPGLDLNRQLITKYNLIKNIPFGLTKEIDVKQFFPLVVFEGLVKSQQRIDLETTYN